ncbi:MFS transporter [Sphingobium baderi]|uniref:MFS transporter n=1 Tax=Sphingobium baderi TaxID=1332080 RepID=UPI002B405989|nr:MFS transporter [Sphingobium baderi]WRD75581.1 MFS transporter [Sphingobium baderi]
MTSANPATGGTLSPARQKYAIGVLLLMYVFAYMDRNVLALMVDPIKESLQISDVQFSLVHGVAFGAFYAVFGLPMGYIVDRFSKRWVLFWGISIWSAATLACGLARSFPTLAFFRFGVGAGEATLVPAAYSTISRILPKDRTAMGIAVFSMGSGIGSAVAIGIGGYLIAKLTKLGGIALPFIGHLEPWQAVFVIIGAPGLFVALLAFTLPETGKSAAAEAETLAPSEPVPLMPFLAENRAYLFFTIGGLALITILAYAFAAWMPALLLRQYGKDVAWVGYVMSAVTLSGLIGFGLSGYFADRLFRAGYKDGHVIPILYCVPVIIVLTIVGFHLTGDIWVAVGCYAIIHILATIGNSVGAHIQLATPPSLRGRLAAITVAAQHLCGLALGPLLVALVTDHWFHDPARVGDSMAIVGTIIGLLAILFYILARAHARAAITRMEEGYYHTPPIEAVA